MKDIVKSLRTFILSWETVKAGGGVIVMSKRVR